MARKSPSMPPRRNEEPAIDAPRRTTGILPVSSLIMPPMQTGIIIVDHGSRRDESNRMLEELAGLFAQRFREKYDIVEPAHMELAEPSIATAYAKCVQRGARR